MDEQHSATFRRREVSELLTAFATVRREARALRPIVWSMLTPGRVGRRVAVPLPSVLTRYFVEHRIKRSLTALLRRLYENAAVSAASPPADEIQALEHFIASGSPIPYRRLTAAFLLTVLLVAYGLSNGVFRSEADAEGIAAAMEGVLTLDPGAAADAVRSFELRGALGAVFTLALALVLVAAPVAASFRVERMLLNVYPAGAESLRREAVTRHASETAGVFRIEANAFALLDDRPPREQPLDLIVRSLSLLMLVWAALVLTVLAVSEATADSAAALAWSPFLLGLAAALILLLALESLLSVRRAVAFRREPSRPRVAKLGNRRMKLSFRLLLAAAAVAAIASGLAAVDAPSSSTPQELYVRIAQVALERKVTFGQYLERSALPTTDISAAHLAEGGLLVDLEIELTAVPGFRVKMDYSVFDAKTHQPLPGAQKRYIADLMPEASGTSSGGARAGIDARELVLLHLGTFRRAPEEPKTEVDTAHWSFWTPLPEKPGNYFIEITARDPQGNPFEMVRTESFPIV
jgi:hypothetical protein